jgi:hypothetical protein
MSFDISTFRSGGLKLGGARPNLFDVQIDGAPVQALKDTEFRLLCKIASIPSSTIGVIEVPYFGRNVKIPGNRTFDNLSVTVMNDEDFKIRNGIEQWMNSLNAHRSNTSDITGAGSANNLSGSILVKHYNRSGVATQNGAWEFKSVYPVALGEIALDWGSNDTIEEFTIDFAYDFWIHKPITT